jgi:hypothetical protein
MGTEATAVWPSERFYWALLAAPPGVRLRGGWELPPGLRGDLGEQLPVPLDEVHTVCTITTDGVLACSAVRSELAGLPVTTLGLMPSQLPAGVEARAGGGVAALNLLRGEFEPRSERARRGRRHLAGLAATALVAALVTVGFARRAAYWEAARVDAATSADALLKKVLPPGGGMPPQALAGEVYRLQQASLATAKIKPPPDAAVALATLLSSWPTSVPSKPQSISVTESGITVSVLLEPGVKGGNAAGDRTRDFLAAFTPPPGWTMLEPRLTGGADFTRVVIDLTPVPPTTGGTP